MHLTKVNALNKGQLLFRTLCLYKTLYTPNDNWLLGDQAYFCLLYSYRKDKSQEIGKRNFTFFFSLVVIYLFIFLILIYFFILKNWFMISVRLSSYGCTREVWRAWGKRKGRFRRYDFAYDYRTRHALIRHDYNTNRVVEIDLQHPYDRRTQREKCRRILKHVLKLYDNRSHIQCYMMRVVYNFCLRKQRALQKIACDKIVPSKSPLRVARGDSREQP